MLTVGSGYVKTVFAEDNTGRIYATQIGDEQLFFTDTSALRTTSVKELNDAVNVTLYPNPAKEGVNIRIKDNSQINQVLLVSITGAVSKHPVVLSGEEYYLSLTNVPKGVYVVQMQTSEGLILQKLLVE